ncbi:MAG: hypothetical protein B7X86_14885 [Sphingobacteriales bacterium 17-39-43]|uniref:hypothetical protein n=1 Tax=Daejeonella sp. TaxID=2805397 RepID=UPI000BC6DBF5|nr:hypothetical protein [Daejeonella sp.]OYZ29479.1 MAG: hypothetical protein B7Y24_14650 [Sphingobacteriales bacterium 16-39-50]OYZ58502.1 MAG: hypothetical protein B7Y19_01930 [Sphingobacteriales bacterium 24-40-4]OZA22609.1 MAG: hypothetical protein B7X86_14885 [Sphingobacteriales bacterium 17-39-43]OZA62147.1 MAG: hypothetical protein B7X75_00515 [Sphingobacteriales bacterium 39-40-5]HQS05052.1 hypothetical protein [Daejeonella sp.]
MTYKEQYLYLKQKTADSYNLWIKAQNQLASDEDGFLNEQLWDNLEFSASDLQKSQNEFNKFCSIIRKGKFSAHDILGEQQACA